MSKRRKILNWREEVKNDPNWNRVEHTMLDGTIISTADREDANTELHAFFDFNGWKYRVVDHSFLGTLAIPVKEILRPRTATTEEALEVVAQEVNATDNPRRACPTLCSGLEIWGVERGINSYERLGLEWNLKCIRARLQYIAGRKDGWTLLNITDENKLVKVVKNCFGSVYVGSSNLDQRSLRINYELMIRFQNPEIADEARGIFAEDLNGCQRIKAEEWSKSRTLWQRPASTTPSRWRPTSRPLIGCR